MFTAQEAKEISGEDQHHLKGLIEHIDSKLKSSPSAQIRLSLMSANVSSQKEGTLPWRVWFAAARAYKEAGWHAYIECDDSQQNRQEYRLVITLTDQDRSLR